MLPDFLKRRSNLRVWFWASIVTALFVAWFAATVDWQTFVGAIVEAGPVALLAALALLTINGLLAALWLIVITGRRHAVGGAFEVVGWQMLASSILPARLGDLAFMYLIHRKLKIAPGRAVFITLYHRLLDLVITSAFFLVSLLLVGASFLGGNTALLAALVLALLVGIVAALEPLLTLGAKLLLWADETFDNRLTRTLLAQLLHVRIWYRHSLSRSLLWLTFAIIAARWLAILAAIGLLIHAMAQPLDWIDSALVANVYIYFSIIPLQTFGGFGVGEMGLAWVLTLYGLGLGKASAISLLIRIIINLLHVGFWLVTVAVIELMKWAGARREAS